ncbi:MAG: hypothetical protein ACQERN_11485 [Thermodesulfobacteriota bacterium]
MSVVYQVDGLDCICFVNQRWFDFAADNDAREMANADSVIGKPLMDFIVGDELRHLYGVLMEKVRQSRQQITVPFRCDSAKIRRYMQMRIQAMPSHALCFESTILIEEKRPEMPLLYPDDAGDSGHRQGLLVMCSWCKAVNVGNNRWVAVEQAVDRLKLFDCRHLPQISHGVCPSCAADIHEKIKAMDLDTSI